MTTVGTDPGECVAELERLAMRAGKEKRALGPDDIKSELTASFESTPFEFAEALLDHDRARATRSLEAMFRRGVRGRDGDTVDRGGVFPFVASWTHQSFANAYEGRFLLDHGVSLREVPKRVGVRAFVPRYQQQVSGNEEPRLRRGLMLLHEAQRDLRLTGTTRHGGGTIVVVGTTGEEAPQQRYVARHLGSDEPVWSATLAEPGGGEQIVRLGETVDDTYYPVSWREGETLHRLAWEGSALVEAEAP